eukprot:8864373-Alexandrium_andersonii.AAC.1
MAWDLDWCRPLCLRLASLPPATVTVSPKLNGMSKAPRGACGCITRVWRSTNRRNSLWESMHVESCGPAK